MRFLADGPLIPDELLLARDQGRVIFFCGAGVSRECANLPNFFELADQVINSLGVTADDPVRKLLDTARISGLVSIDRVFGLLERDFFANDIWSAVANAVKPSSTVDLSAHRIILDLSTTPVGKTRLVTTNFDLLFESCNSSLPSSQPPRLPNPLDDKEFEGIIHLHGRVDKDYQRADGNGFILSSSDFGRAYLSEGWATDFIRSILDRYIVVFVGYTADDPPVQYLLEALRGPLDASRRAYAFQSGSQGEAEAKWRYKGVIPIAYDDAENHKALWDTLSAWAVRARDSSVWIDTVIEMAQRGPEALLPHERGQVAHVVSTLEGMRRFATSSNPPPAEWLCVFDPMVRFSQPGYIGGLGERGPYVDPFQAYGLDSDPVPSKIKPGDGGVRREIPSGVWDCFTSTSTERLGLSEEYFAKLRGYRANNPPRLSPRLWHLCIWIGRVVSQPATAWWASAQSNVHPDLRYQLCRGLKRAKGDCLPEVRKAWRLIFAAWNGGEDDPRHEWYEFEASLPKDGWTEATCREFARIKQPYLKITRPFKSVKPPRKNGNIRSVDMVELEVEYPDPSHDAQIPDTHLAVAIREFRRNLEHVIFLEREIDGYRLYETT